MPSLYCTSISLLCLFDVQLSFFYDLCLLQHNLYCYHTGECPSDEMEGQTAKQSHSRHPQSYYYQTQTRSQGCCIWYDCERRQIVGFTCVGLVTTVINECDYWQSWTFRNKIVKRVFDLYTFFFHTCHGAFTCLHSQDKRITEKQICGPQSKRLHAWVWKISLLYGTSFESVYPWCWDGCQEQIFSAC